MWIDSWTLAHSSVQNKSGGRNLSNHARIIKTNSPYFQVAMRRANCSLQPFNFAHIFPVAYNSVVSVGDIKQPSSHEDPAPCDNGNATSTCKKKCPLLGLN